MIEPIRPVHPPSTGAWVTMVLLFCCLFPVVPVPSTALGVLSLTPGCIFFSKCDFHFHDAVIEIVIVSC